MYIYIYIYTYIHTYIMGQARADGDVVVVLAKDLLYNFEANRDNYVASSLVFRGPGEGCRGHRRPRKRCRVLHVKANAHKRQGVLFLMCYVALCLFLFVSVLFAEVLCCLTGQGQWGSRKKGIQL